MVLVWDCLCCATSSFTIPLKRHQYDLVKEGNTRATAQETTYLTEYATSFLPLLLKVCFMQHWTIQKSTFAVHQ